MLLSEAGRQNFFKKSFEKPLTKPPRCATMTMSRGSKPRNPVVANTEEVEEENLKKKFLKPLDKPHNP